jgi:hypothetical protein
MVSTSKFFGQLAVDFPSQNPGMWIELRQKILAKGVVSAPQLMLMITNSGGSETSACLVSRLAEYIRNAHREDKTHVMDANSMHDITEWQHLHVPMFLNFALERDHSMVVLNAQSLTGESIAQINPIFNRVQSEHKQPTFAFFLATVDSERPLVSKSDVIKYWGSIGWDEKEAIQFLDKTSLFYVVPERNVRCD